MWSHPVVSASPGNLSGDSDSHIHSNSSETETLGETHNWCFNKPSRRFEWLLKFEHRCSPPGLSLLIYKIMLPAQVIFEVHSSSPLDLVYSLEQIGRFFVLDLEPFLGCVIQIIQLKSWHVGNRREPDLWELCTHTPHRMLTIK